MQLWDLRLGFDAPLCEAPELPGRLGTQLLHFTSLLSSREICVQHSSIGVNAPRDSEWPRQLALKEQCEKCGTLSCTGLFQLHT